MLFPTVGALNLGLTLIMVARNHVDYALLQQLLQQSVLQQMIVKMCLLTVVLTGLQVVTVI